MLKTNYIPSFSYHVFQLLSDTDMKLAAGWDKGASHHQAVQALIIIGECMVMGSRCTEHLTILTRINVDKSLN